MVPDFYSVGVVFISLIIGAKAITTLRRKTKPPPNLLNPPKLPPPLKDKRNRWWLASGIYAIFIFFLSVVPVVQDLPPIQHVDKWAHLCEYLVFAWLLVRTLFLARGILPGSLILAWLFASSYGYLMELIQLMLPWRTADVADAGANALGAALGVWIGHKMFRAPNC